MKSQDPVSFASVNAEWVAVAAHHARSSFALVEVVTNVPASLELHTPNFIREMIDEVMDKKDAEAMHMLRVFIDQAHSPLLRNIKAFMGDKPCLSGGTIGDLREKLEEALLITTLAYFIPSPLRFRLSGSRDWCSLVWLA